MSSVSYPAATPFLVVFGRDQAGKPHASWFDQASAELATKAAALMNMRAVQVETDELRELIGTLPRGRVFSSGRAFTPFISGKLYNRLIELTRELLGLSQSEIANETGVASPDEAVDKGSDPAVEHSSTAAKARRDKAAARVAGQDATDGVTQDSAAAAPSVDTQSTTKASKRPTRIEEIGLGSMLLATTGPTEGWFEVEVLGINGTMLTLKWCDYAEPTVVRRLHEVGFLPTLQH